MCGIAGFTHRSEPWPEGVLRHAVESIRHRGPDQNGVYESECVSLGVVRLKIIDLAGGDQPIYSDDGGTIIAFNGEIYNFRELREELEDLGRRFHTQSDTEVVLQAFLEWDVECFARLRGMFAVALWQEGARRLVLARDRMGIKPLYVYRRGEELHFGSELKALLAHPAVRRRVDPAGLELFLRHNYISTRRTLIDGVEKLRPGTWLQWCDGTVREGAYWELKVEPRARGLAEAKEELDSLLRASVREHLVSDVPLGVWLSGGLDSSTITHYAAQEFGGRLKTFSVSFRGRSFDETPYFREVAAQYGTEHEEFDLQPEEGLAGVVEKLAHHSDEPTADAGALPVWYLSQMCRRRVTVALSGEGADELFGGYITYLADAYAEWAPRGAGGLVRAAARLLPVGDEKVGLEYKLRRFGEGLPLPAIERHLFWNGAFGTEALRRVLPDAGELTREWPLDRARDFLELDQLAYLPDDILNKCDRMSMAHSLEVRPAFLDHRIVEFANSLPLDLKIRGRGLKFLLRELMRDKLPAAVTGRAKQGFDIPAHHWFRTVLKPMLLDLVNERETRRHGLLRWEGVDALMREHFERRANHGYALWGLLMLSLWIREWNVEAR